LADPIPQHGDTPRLIERQPMLDPISEPLEADPGVVYEIGDDASVEPAVVALVEGGGEIPAGRDERRVERVRVGNDEGGGGFEGRLGMGLKDGISG
jgi:hypothetical protein